jgi:hypothetical protein
MKIRSLIQAVTHGILLGFVWFLTILALVCPNLGYGVYVKMPIIGKTRQSPREMR